MSKVMFTITYSIHPEKREEYLKLIAEMKDHLINVGKKNYSVYEVKGKKNQFTEMFVTDTMEEFDALEDNQDEKTHELVSKLEEYVANGGMRYTTLVEVP
jgi:L-rhamnose mutarotase